MEVEIMTNYNARLLFTTIVGIILSINFCCYAYPQTTDQIIMVEIKLYNSSNLPKPNIYIDFNKISDNRSLSVSEDDKRIFINDKTLDVEGKPLKKNQGYICVKRILQCYTFNNLFYEDYDFCLVSAINGLIINYKESNSNDELSIMRLRSYKYLQMFAEGVTDENVSFRLKADNKIIPKINIGKGNIRGIKFSDREISTGLYNTILFKNIPKNIHISSGISIKKVGYYVISRGDKR
jgi:hypothetical protein